MCCAPAATCAADVLEHDVDGNRAKPSVVDRHDRAMTAEMLAAARGVGAANDPRANHRASAARRIGRAAAGPAIRLNELRVEARLHFGRVLRSLRVRRLTTRLATSPAPPPPRVPARASTPRSRSHAAFSGAYSPYAADARRGLTRATRSISGAARRVAVCIGR